MRDYLPVSAPERAPLGVSGGVSTPLSLVVGLDLLGAGACASAVVTAVVGEVGAAPALPKK